MIQKLPRIITTALLVLGSNPAQAERVAYVNLGGVNLTAWCEKSFGPAFKANLIGAANTSPGSKTLNYTCVTIDSSTMTCTCTPDMDCIQMGKDGVCGEDGSITCTPDGSSCSCSVSYSPAENPKILDKYNIRKINPGGGKLMRSN